MVNFSQVQTGLTKYVDNEIMGKISGWRKWAMGTIVGIALSKSTEAFDQIKRNQFVKMMGIIDADDHIDLDLLYEEAKKQAKENGAITFDVPMIGSLTLNETDVDKLYEYIRNS